MIAQRKAAFDTGPMYMTPGIRVLIERGAEVEIMQAISRHLSGDWGEVDEEDKESNWNSLQDGSRLLSAYSIQGERVWIITEAEDDNGQRAATTILLPEEY